MGVASVVVGVASVFMGVPSIVYLLLLPVSLVMVSSDGEGERSAE